MLRINPKFLTAAKVATTGPDLHALLQKAIELELSTIPSYLAAGTPLNFDPAGVWDVPEVCSTALARG